MTLAETVADVIDSGCNNVVSVYCFVAVIVTTERLLMLLYNNLKCGFVAR